MLEEYLLEALQDLARSHCMRFRADFKIHIGSRQTQLLEEDIGHVGVVVLAGMDQDLFDVRPQSQGSHHGRDLHKVGPRARPRAELASGFSSHRRWAVAVREPVPRPQG